MIAASFYCSRCGALNAPQAAACFACGQALSAASAAPAVAATPPTDASDLLAPGTLLKGRYRILAQVGQGGFGAVYKAEDCQMGNWLVAVKEMSLSHLSQQEVAEATEAFQREASILAELSHAGLPRIYEHFREGGRWYLVMEFIQGETLEAHLGQAPGGFLPVRETLHLGIQLCTILGYLHTHDPPVIFRDLKPANVMLTSKREVYLIDFGIARHLKPGKRRDTMAFGSPGYAAPEQYGVAQTTSRSDLYSLGMLLEQMLTGLDPATTPLRYASLGVPAPAGLEALLKQLVELDPQARPRSAALVKQRLHQLEAEWVGQQQQAGHSAGGAKQQAKATHHKQAAILAAQPSQAPARRGLVKRLAPYLIAVLAMLVCLTLLALVIYGVTQSGSSRHNQRPGTVAGATI